MDGGNVRRVMHCDLSVTDTPWPYAQAHADEIDALWAVQQRANPVFFNGPIHLMHAHELRGDTFVGRFLRSDFKTYLFLRDRGYADPGIRDTFGSGLLRSADGAYILGRQSPGHVNSGLTYLPGGFIDGRDVAADGTIDIRTAVAREVGEEMGFPPGTFEELPGAILTFAGPLISIAIEMVSQLPAAELQARARAHIATETDPELEDIVVVSGPGDLAGLAMTDYARILLEALFAPTL